jgi:GTPase
MRFLTLCALIVALPAGAFAPDPDDFRMTVRDAFTVTDQGVFITGVVEDGPVAVNDVVCLRPAEGEQREMTVVGILRLSGGREEVEAAEPGMMVALRFTDIEKDDAKVGDTLTADCGS